MERDVDDGSDAAVAFDDLDFVEDLGKALLENFVEKEGAVHLPCFAR